MLFAQRITDRRSADIRGGGGDGKCTIEVLVDDVAEVEIRGNNAVIRTLTGAPSSFRRFQCNQSLPTNPYDFRFKGIDGRGRQDLVRPAENGRPAVVRIEDSKGGSEGYTFDIMWRGGSGNYSDDRYNDGFGRDRDRDRYRDDNRYGDRNRDRWNDGWGQGNGWSHGNVTASHRGGDGYFIERNGRRARIERVTVGITENGLVSLGLETDNGRKTLIGNVQNRDSRRVFARVNGSGVRGLLEIEMTSSNDVRRLDLRDDGQGSLNWSR